MIMNELQHCPIHLPLLASTFLCINKALANAELAPIIHLFLLLWSQIRSTCQSQFHSAFLQPSPTNMPPHWHPVLCSCTTTNPVWSKSVNEIKGRFPPCFQKSRETHFFFLFLCPHFLLRSSSLYKIRKKFCSKEHKAAIVKKWLVSAGYIDMQHLHTHMVLHQQNHAFRELLAARQDTMNHEQAQNRMYLNMEIKDHRKHCNFSPV